MAYAEKKGRHIISGRDAKLAFAKAERDYLILDRDTALNILNQLCLKEDGMPIHGLIVRDNTSQFITRTVRENGEYLPVNDFLVEPSPREDRKLTDIVEIARLAAFGDPQHIEVVDKLVVIDRTSNGKVFGLEELRDVTKIDLGWVGVLDNRTETKVIILSKKYSRQGINEFSPPRAIH